MNAAAPQKLDGEFPSFLIDLAYGASLLTASPVLAYRLWTSERYRAGLGQRLGNISVRKGEATCLWIHAASVGEMLASLPLIRECRTHRPDIVIAISTQTLTGQQMAAKHCPDCLRFYYPLDFSSVVRRAFESIRPSLVVLVEREIWPNFMAEARRRNVPVVQVNGRIADNSVRAYRWLYPALGAALAGIKCYSVQTEEYAERLRSLTIPSERIHVTGNLKYDGLPMSIPEAEQSRLRGEMGVEPGDSVLIGGSIHPPEEKPLIRAYQRVRQSLPSLRLILAPRHPERVGEVERSIAEAGESAVRKSQCQKAVSPDSESRGKIILVDTVGELRAIYSLGTVVFVGGTLVPVGGHNLMEPAALGKPVVFGPQTFKQKEDADALVRAEGGFACLDEGEVANRIGQLFNDASFARSMGTRGQEIVQNHAGAALRTWQLIRPYLPER